MKLLIVAQVIDKNHPILGFFHRWVEEFAKHYESIEVICLQAGDYSLPANVTVHSLGKESGNSKIGYLLRFYSLLWSLRKDYDQVFVHMNQIYVILGAWLWRLLRKPIGLWYAHGAVSNSLKLAVFFTNYVFTSTKEGLRIDTPKRVLVGQGIDIEIFKKPNSKISSDTQRLVTVGRVGQSKNIETLLNACSILKKAGVKFNFNIIGVPITNEEVVYEKSMRALTKELDIEDEVRWGGAVSNHELPVVLQQSDIFIHDGSTNSLDKALLEAVLCGCIVVSSNPAYISIVESMTPNFTYTPKMIDELVVIISNIIETNLETSANKMLPVQNFIVDNYTVGNLISNIVKKY